jgi:hypothetical protein
MALVGRYGLFLLFCTSFYLLIKEADKATNTEQLLPNMDGMLVAAIFFILTGLITMGIAREKGRVHISWFAFGTLLCFVALPLAIMIEPKNPGPGMMACPKCAIPIDEKARYCQHCGVEVRFTSKR